MILPRHRGSTISALTFALLGPAMFLSIPARALAASALLSAASVNSPAALARPAAPWKELAPGMELGVFEARKKSTVGDSKITVLRRDVRREALERFGSYETSFETNDRNDHAWPVPNVIGVVGR